MHTALTVLGWIVAILGVVALMSHSGFAFMMRRARRRDMIGDEAEMFTPMLVTGFIMDTALIVGGIALIIFA